MSFSHTKRGACDSLRHSRSSGALDGLTAARRSRNGLQRRPLPASHSTQCLFPAVTSGDADEDEEVPATLYTTLTTATYVQYHDLSGSDSEYSEYDLVNEQMQGFLLDSDDSLHGDDVADGVLGVGAYCVSSYVSAHLPETHHAHLRRRTATPQRRRRMAKKADSSVSLASNAARVTPSSSSMLLSDVETNLRGAVTAAGGGLHGQRRQRKHGRSTAGERRWLVPALAFIGDAHRAPSLRRQLPLFTVVFDLDETLVGARHGTIQLRPHIGELLRALHELPVEIILWTAGTAHYVNPILHAIGQACGRQEWFHHIISRHKRWYTGANTSVKDLSQLGRSMDRVLMIENNPISVVQQPDLCVLVEDYVQANAADESLLVLQGVLERLVDAYRNAERGAVAAEENMKDSHGTRTGSGAHESVQAGVAVDPSSIIQRCRPPPLSELLRQDAALQTVAFRMEDVCSEEGVSMSQKVELKERVGGAETLLCCGLRYSPSLPSTLAPLSVAAARSYGCVHPLLLP